LPILKIYLKKYQNHVNIYCTLLALASYLNQIP